MESMILTLLNSLVNQVFLLLGKTPQTQALPIIPGISPNQMASLTEMINQHQSNPATMSYVDCLMMILLSAFALWTVSSLKSLKKTLEDAEKAQNASLDTFKKNVTVAALESVDSHAKTCRILTAEDWAHFQKMKIWVAKLLNIISLELKDWDRYLFDLNTPEDKIPEKKKKKIEQRPISEEDNSK